MNLKRRLEQIGYRKLSLILIAFLAASAGGLLSISKTDYQVSLSSVVDIWSDFLRDVDNLGQMIINIEPSVEMEIGREIERQWTPAHASSEGSKYQDYVTRVGNSLLGAIRRTEIGYRFHVIPSEAINAYAIPGGGVFITTAMLEFLESEAELAAILGHEISHVDLSHCIDRLKYELAVRRVLGHDIAILARIGHELIRLGYSEQHELEADSNGMLLAANAGYEPRAAIDVFVRLLERQKEEIDTNSGQKPGTMIGELAGAVFKAGKGYFATHPAYPSRVSALETTYRRNLSGWGGVKFLQRKEEYQRIKTGITTRHQDDPAALQAADVQNRAEADACSTDLLTTDALQSATETWEKTGRSPEVLALLNEATEASQPPECDNIRARILADKAKRLAENIAAGRPIDATEKTSVDSECQVSQAAEDALERAWDQKDKSLEIIELLQLAEVAAEPPECDSVRAKILADKAYERLIQSRNQL